MWKMERTAKRARKEREEIHLQLTGKRRQTEIKIHLADGKDATRSSETSTSQIGSLTTPWPYAVTPWSFPNNKNRTYATKKELCNTGRISTSSV
ncbi:hypothetical protein XENTR_v10005924 [Xenopus tropicalis]|nr:hypothetical protein XENTR_v10005924 [Xenopus tropicalis]